MKVFVTGATGFIGSEVVKELIRRGYDVLGLARSDSSQAKLEAVGAQVLRGSLDTPDVLAKGAAESDGVIHLAFVNDFNNYEESLKKDLTAIKAMENELVNTNKPFVNTSGTLMVEDLGRPATEKDISANPVGRAEDEILSLSYADKGVRATAVRLSPTVHDVQRQGFGTILAGMAVNSGKAAYVGDGANVWPSVHRKDAAKLFVNALENGKAGSVYNAAAEVGIPVKEIAQTIGETLNLPVKKLDQEAGKAYFGWFIDAIQQNNPTSSELTQSELDWHPTEASLLEDMKTFLSDSKNVEALKNNG